MTTDDRPRWQQARAAYPIWEAVGEIGVARIWRNEGASPGWGWQVLTDAGALVAGGMCEAREDAEAAAFDAVGICEARGSYDNASADEQP